MSVMPVTPRRAIIMPVRGRSILKMTVSQRSILMKVAPGAAAAQSAAEDAEQSALEAAASAAAAEGAEAGVAADAAAAAASAAAALVSENNAETAETNAEAAQAAAELAASNAATSETNAGNSASAAQTAETNAETAEANAEIAQAAAASSASDAQTAENNAETAQAAAEAAQAAAEAAAASVDLPIIAPGDAGKTLVVKVTEDGYELDVPASSGVQSIVAGSGISVNATDPANPIVSSTGGGAVDSVNGQTGVVVLDADDIDDTSTTHKFATAAELSKLSGIETAADVTDAGNVGSAIHGATGKTTPVDADTIPLIDSAASNVLKKVTWANIKATLKTYFDTLYYIVGGTDVSVADGGTGRSSHTAYAVLCGGTSTTAAQQSIASVGTSGHVLTSNGAGALPTFQAAAGASNIPTSSVLPVGAWAVCRVDSNISDGATMAGSIVFLMTADETGTLEEAQVQSGTWRNISGTNFSTTGSGNFGLCVRIS